MTPLRYYTTTYSGYNSKNIKKVGKFELMDVHDALPHAFYNGRYEMNYMNELMIPSEEEIMRVQLYSAHWNFPYDQAFADQLNELSGERFSLEKLGKKEFAIEDMLEIIESVFTVSFKNEDGTLNRKIIDALSNRLTSKIAKDEDYLNVYREALDRLKAVYDMFQTDTGFINEARMKNSIDKVDWAIKALEADIGRGRSNHNAKTGYFRIDENGRPINGKNTSLWQNEKDGKGKAKKYDDTIISHGNDLKGRWFERQVIEFLLKIIDVNNVGIIDTANVQTPTFNILGSASSNYKTSRTDAFLYDLSKNIEITYYINKTKKTADLKTFMNDCNKANGTGEVISVPAGEWERLIGSGAVSGVQAKSGKNQSIINDYKVATPDAFKLAGTEWYRMFNHMIQWYGHGNIYATHEDYDAIFNYGVSHAIQYAIGIGNNYLALRNRIVPTVVYLEEQIRKAKYIRARQHVDFTTPDAEININLAEGPAGFRKK